MAARGPNDLSNDEILHIVRDIIGQITSNDDLLNTRGILRVAGSNQDTEAILESGTVPHITSTNIHTVIDVLKRSLSVMKTRIAAIDPEGLAALQDVAKDLSDDELSKATFATAFDEFIDNLAKSGDMQKEALGEILHNYMHLGHAISQFQETNLMTPNNCAIVIGPKMNEVLNLIPIPNAGDPMLAMSAASKASLVNDAIRMGVASDNYNIHFDQKYAEVRFASRQRMIEDVKLQTEKAGLSLERLNSLLEKVNLEMRQTERTLATLTSQKSQIKGGILHRRTPEEKKFLAQTKEKIAQERQHYAAVSERLAALHKDIERFEENSRRFNHLRSDLRASMDRVERYLPTTPTTTDSDTSPTVSDDEIVPTENTRRVFLASSAHLTTTTTTAATTATTTAPDVDQEQDVSAEDTPPRSPRSSQ